MSDQPENNKEEFEQEKKSCDECGGPLVPEKMRLEEFLSGKLFVINDAPVLACQNCGEIWVPETIIDELEQMIRLNKERSKHKLKKETSKTIKPHKKRKTKSKKKNNT